MRVDTDALSIALSARTRIENRGRSKRGSNVEFKISDVKNYAWSGADDRKDIVVRPEDHAGSRYVRVEFATGGHTQRATLTRSEALALAGAIQGIAAGLGSIE